MVDADQRLSCVTRVREAAYRMGARKKQGDSYRGMPGPNYSMRVDVAALEESARQVRLAGRETLRIF